MVVNRDGIISLADSQDTMIVIQRGGDADSAVITTRLADQLGRVLFEQTEKVWVAPRDGVYTLTVNVPEPDLPKGRPWVVHAVLPPDCEARGEPPPDSVQLPAIDGGRTVLMWRGTADPPINVIWLH